MSFTPTDKIPPIPRKFWIFLYILFLLALFGLFTFSLPFGFLSGFLLFPLICFTYWKRND